MRADAVQAGLAIERAECERDIARDVGLAHAVGKPMGSGATKTLWATGKSVSRRYWRRSLCVKSLGSDFDGVLVQAGWPTVCW